MPPFVRDQDRVREKERLRPVYKYILWLDISRDIVKDTCIEGWMQCFLPDKYRADARAMQFAAWCSRELVSWYRYSRQQLNPMHDLWIEFSILLGGGEGVCNRYTCECARGVERMGRSLKGKLIDTRNFISLDPYICYYMYIVGMLKIVFGKIIWLLHHRKSISFSHFSICDSLEYIHLLKCNLLDRSVQLKVRELFSHY